jgi:hypothetical protein
MPSTLPHHWDPAVRFPEPPGAGAPGALTVQSLVMGERLPAIQEARARNSAEDRLRTVLAVFDRPSAAGRART